ncbi:MAG: dihydrofolate reductase [Coxiella endosymbiont of Dermacentor silvarum]
MVITLVAAMDKNNHVIGQNNRLPWHLPADLTHFKSITLGKPIVMGRKTFESIGKSLPHRRNIVITQKKNLIIEDCEIFHSLDEVLDSLIDESEIMIIGGGQLFKEALPQAGKMILTIIEHSFDGDVYFPFWDDKKWYIVSKIDYKPDKNNPYRFSFLELSRIN